VWLRSKQDSATQNKQNSLSPGTSTKKFIKQIGSEVQIGFYQQDSHQNSLTINCSAPSSARQLALELSGTKQFSHDRRQLRYRKLLSHPWYGTVLLEELSGDDRYYIVLFISENSTNSDDAFNLKVHQLFVDDSRKPTNHALIQEILSLVAMEKS
jgi:hypothetical protein